MDERPPSSWLRRASMVVALAMAPVGLAACGGGGSDSATPTTLSTSCKDLAKANKALGEAVHVTTATPESLTTAIKHFAGTLKDVESGLPSSTSGQVKALKHQLVTTRIHLAGSEPVEFGDDLYAARQHVKAIRKACGNQN